MIASGGGSRAKSAFTHCDDSRSPVSLYQRNQSRDFEPRTEMASSGAAVLALGKALASSTLSTPSSGCWVSMWAEATNRSQATALVAAFSQTTS